MSYTYQYKWELVSGTTGVHSSWQSMSTPQIVELLERQYHKGCVAKIDGVDVALQSKSATSDNDIQAGWALAFERIRTE